MLYRVKYYIRMDYRSPSVDTLYTLFKHARRREHALNILCHRTSVSQERDIIKMLLGVKWLFNSESDVRKKLVFADVPGQPDKLSWVYQNAGRQYITVAFDDNILNLKDVKGRIMENTPRVWKYISKGCDTLRNNDIPWLSFGTNASVSRCRRAGYSNKRLENSPISDGIVVLNNPLLYRIKFRYKPLGYGYDDIDFNRQLNRHANAMFGPNSIEKGKHYSLFSTDKGKRHTGSWKKDVEKKFRFVSPLCSENEFLDHVSEVARVLRKVPEVREGAKNVLGNRLILD